MGGTGSWRGIVRSLLGTAALCLVTFAAAPALADDPPPPDQVPLYDRYAATQAYVEGGDAGLAAFDAERNRVLGADDQAVDVEDRPDGTRDVTIQLEVIEVQEEVYPGKRDTIVQALTYDWSQDAFAPTCEMEPFAPGTLAKFWPEIMQPDGRLYFAGTYADPLSRGMESCVRSAARVAKEIADA